MILKNYKCKNNLLFSIYPLSFKLYNLQKKIVKIFTFAKFVFNLFYIQEKS